VSDVAKGAKRVGAAMTALSQHGYRCARLSASGQRRGARKSENGIAGDIIALAPPHTHLPHVLVEVGGEKKVVSAALAELRDSIMPGFAPIVCRVVNRRKRWHLGPHREDAFDSLEEALDALRDI